MKDFYEIIYEFLEKKESFVLATILEKSGSAPRDQGTKMIIKRDFSIIGTIGGGIFEAMAIKLASKVFQNGNSIIRKFSLINKGASALGAACGGDVKLLLEYIDFDDNKILEIYKKVSELKRKGINFTLVTKISEEGKDIRKINKWICTEIGFFGEEDDIVQSIFRKIRENFKNITFEKIDKDREEYLIEPIFNNESVYILGAGHVAQKIADITKMLDFKTIVLDDREEFANRERFKTADEVKVIPSFDNLLNHITVDCRSYIIIVTRGHAFDKEVLSQMLKTDAKYIGMIGSKTKRDVVYKCLLNEGYSIKDMERVYCPIGLSIFAQTPEEIAVSIAGELVRIRRLPL
jgi:Xanthine and CO dehydrogenases maturation factor, XdhC/CoxF family